MASIDQEELVAVSMPFQELPPDMLAQRRARLRRGIATVPQEDFLPLLCSCFRRRLQASLRSEAPVQMEAGAEVDRKMNANGF